jgi:hypothetical protein
VSALPHTRQAPLLAAQQKDPPCCVAGTTFGDINVDIKAVKLSVQASTLGICGAVTSIGTTVPASVSVSKLTPSLIGQPITLQADSSFDLSKTQCDTDALGKVTAGFTAANTGNYPLGLTAVLDNSLPCNFGGEQLVEQL